MKKDLALTQESFDKLLAWLDADREQAGQKYEEIRRELIRYFLIRGYYNEAEELADETINRAAQKIDAMAEMYERDRMHYFYAVARLVCMARLRKEAA